MGYGRAWVSCSLGLLMGSACAASPAIFACTDDSQCTDGICQPTGFCSFPSADCASGQKYDRHAGSDLSGSCVEPGSGGGETGSATSDSGTSGGPPPPGPDCGNGDVNVGEECDGINLAGRDCTTEGYGGGELRCASNCQLDESDCKGCIDPDACMTPGGTGDTGSAGETSGGPTGDFSCVDEDLPGILPLLVNGSTVGQTNDDSAPCFAPGSPDYTYRFTAPTTGFYRFDTAGSPYDTALFGRGGGCNDPVRWCNDDAGFELTSRLGMYLLAAEEVVLVVDGFGGDFGTYTLSGGIIPGQCDGPPIDGAVLPAMVSGDTTNENDKLSGSCGSGGTADALFPFTAPADGQYTISAASAVIEPMLLVLDGTCGAELACVDLGSFNGMEYVTTANVDLAAGQTVTIVVEGYFDDGPFTVTVQ